MDFAYYFLAATTHVDTQAPSNSMMAGWCTEYTSNKEMAEYVQTKSNFPVIFSAHVQGCAVEKVVSLATGRKPRDNKAAPRKADEIKGELVANLRHDLSKSCGAYTSYLDDTFLFSDVLP
jgi:hypothetical protein